MTLDTNVLEADREFRAGCSVLQCATWNIDPSARSLYLTGITVQRPQTPLQEAHERQIPAIIALATNIARRHRLTPLYEYPVPTADGSLVIYVGWEREQHL